MVNQKVPKYFQDGISLSYVTWNRPEEVGKSLSIRQRRRRGLVADEGDLENTQQARHLSFSKQYNKTYVSVHCGLFIETAAAAIIENAIPAVWDHSAVDETWVRTEPYMHAAARNQRVVRAY